MLKKLQNLLFEEEDEDYIDDEEEELEAEPEAEAQPVKPAPAPVKEEVKAAPAETPAPAVKPARVPEVPKEEPRTTMQRIDVTQPVEKISDTVKTETKPAVQKASPRPVQETKANLGITVDTAYPEKKAEAAKKPEPAKKAEKPAETKSARPAEKKRSRNAYEFQPVISPIFGVDEKDLNALKTTTQKYASPSAQKSSANTSAIISPIYGANKEAIPTTIQPTVEKSNQVEQLSVTPEKAAAEENLDNFSLDDILRVRDEEYKDTLGENDDTMSLFPDLTFPDDPDDDDDFKVTD